MIPGHCQSVVKSIIIYIHEKLLSSDWLKFPSFELNDF